jgi:hypothetical protein
LSYPTRPHEAEVLGAALEDDVEVPKVLDDVEIFEELDDVETLEELDDVDVLEELDEGFEEVLEPPEMQLLS